MGSTYGRTCSFSFVKVGMGSTYGRTCSFSFVKVGMGSTYGRTCSFSFVKVGMGSTYGRTCSFYYVNLGMGLTYGRTCSFYYVNVGMGSTYDRTVNYSGDSRSNHVTSPVKIRSLACIRLLMYHSRQCGVDMDVPDSKILLLDVSILWVDGLKMTPHIEITFHEILIFIGSE